MSGSRDLNPLRWKKIFRREDWNLVYQILSANCSSTMFPGHRCSNYAGFLVMSTQEIIWYIIIMMINIPVYLKETVSNLMIYCESLSLNAIGFFFMQLKENLTFIKSAKGIIIPPTPLNTQVREL